LTLQFVKSPKFQEKTSKRNIDVLGILLLAIAVGSLQYVLEKGHDDDWFNDNIIILLSVTAVLGIFFFIWRELTYKNPIVELRVLKNGNLRIGTILTFILGFGLYGSTFVIPLYTQSILGWTAEDAGLLFIPSGIATAFMMPVIGKLLERGVKQQYLVAGGLLIFFLYSLWAYKILTPDTPADAFWWLLMFRGFGLSMLFIPITTLALSTLHGKEIGQGAAFTGMMRQLGGSFGVAIITTYLANKNMTHRVNLISNLNASDPAVQNRVSMMQHSFMANGKTPDLALQSAYQSLDFSVTKQAMVLSYMDVFLFLGVIFLICVPFVLMINGNRDKKVDMSAAMH